MRSNFLGASNRRLIARQLKFHAVICLIVGLSAWSVPARADCVSECQASVYCDSTEGESECARKQNDCYLSQCNRPTNRFGAIAYGAGTQAVGWAYDKQDANSAEQTALSFCKKHGDDCELVASFSNSCAALAAGENGKFATGSGDTRGEAEAAARSRCADSAGGDCDIQAWSCAKP